MPDLSKWPWMRIALGVVAAVLIILLVIWPGWAYQVDAIGLGASFSPAKNPQGLRDYYPSKTLWDWMQLLLVPAVLAGAAWWLNMVQQRRSEGIEARREQDSVLDTYLNQMANLLLHEKLSEQTDEGKRAQHVARPLTLTALRRFDGDRKGTVMRFLIDSRLIPVVDLGDADLTGARLTGAKLVAADLRWADLSRTSLDKADLNGANLLWADLTAANLSSAKLNGADLGIAELGGADLSGATWAVPICARPTWAGPICVAQRVPRQSS